MWGPGLVAVGAERAWARSNAAWLCLLISLACSIGCSTGPEEEDSKSAQQQCLDYVAGYCTKSVSCAQTTDKINFDETCRFSFRVYLPCEKVTAAQGTQACLAALDAISCASVPAGSFPAFPTACRGIFELP